jgi:hypothetical protein
LIEIRFTENLTGNLRNVEAFWDENQYPQGFDGLIDELTDSVVPIIKRHPRMGRNFLQRQPRSVDAVARIQKLDALLRTLATDAARAEVREYVMTDYLLLYALVGEVIYLLAIKHHKQLSFDIDL